MSAHPSPLLAALFPAEVRAAEQRQPGDPALLYPEEAAHLRQAIAKRVGEFAAGRLCAREALAQLGIARFPLLVGGDRRPQWPENVVGSITHTQGFGGAVAAPRERIRAIGVDAEVVGRVKPALWPKICAPQEIDWLGRLPAAEQERLGALVFSAKEAFYKCQYAVTRQWLEFTDVTVDFTGWELGAGSFAVRPLGILRLLQHHALPWLGRFRLHDGLVITAICLAGD